MQIENNRGYIMRSNKEKTQALKHTFIAVLIVICIGLLFYIGHIYEEKENQKTEINL